jgi:histidyl-tRNA synthetase
MAKLQRAKGTRDFNPSEKILRNKIVDILKNNFELYGFSPIETPIIERYDILSSKYAGGTEILKETFKFNDQGKRELGLRYDLTVPLCRFIGMNPEIKLPFKRYQIERVFRDGPIKLGRYREFWQCDIDIIGSNLMLAEMQLIEVANKSFSQLNLEIEIKINNRKLMNGLMNDLNINDKEKVILIIDKLNKVGEENVKKEILSLGIDENQVQELFNVFKIKDINQINVKDKEGLEGLNELKELFNYLNLLNIKTEFDITLARGLSYYTGTVFEIFLKNNDIKSACAGGGRYNNMVSNFLQSKQIYPAVGISFGLEVLSDALKNTINKKNVTELFIIPINTLNESIKIASELRNKGIKTDIDLMNRGISKNLQYANSLEIKYVAIIGEDELKQNKIKLKNMINGEEKLCFIDEIKLD